MPSPNVVRAIAALVPGRRVRVLSGGDTHELPLKPPAPAVEPPHPLELLSKQFLERDAETRATVAAVAEAVTRMGATAAEVRAAVAEVAAGQAEVAASVNEMTGTLHLPVKPVYDQDGKLLYAQRVKNPEPR